MSDIEKIYCCDKNDNDAALVAAIMANNNRRDNEIPAYMYANNGMNEWINNPFAYLMFLALFRNGGFGDNAGVQNAEVQAQLNAIRTQLQDNQNSSLIMDAIKCNDFAISQLSQNLGVSFNALQKCCCDLQAAIQQIAGQVGFSAERVINAVNMGDCNIIQALKDCCCQTQRQISDFRGDLFLQNCKDTGELRNGQRDLGQAITQGFAATSYETQRQTCDIINNQNNNTQRIIDTLNSHWKDQQALEIQDLKSQISQLKQTEAIISKLGYNGCGRNTGCGGSCL